MSKAIHQEVVFSAAPAELYALLMQSDKHAQLTGAPAVISEDVGGAFSCHNGQIVGRNIELVPNQRIVQAWRVANWDEGVYSLVRMRLQADGDGTRLILDHTGAPEGTEDHLASGWEARYWEPMRKLLG